MHCRRPSAAGVALPAAIGRRTAFPRFAKMEFKVGSKRGILLHNSDNVCSANVAAL